MDDAQVQEYLDAARKEDLLMFLDIQMGHSTVEAEVPHVLPFLRDPRVHLALDPEFATPPDQEPGDVIGGMDAAEINKAQEALQKLVDEYRLPNKILVVHQFWSEMIRNKEALQQFPNVDLVIDMDGFGPASDKIAGYERFVKEDGAAHGGMKLFYEQDTGLMPPEQVDGLEPQPDVVIYSSEPALTSTSPHFRYFSVILNEVKDLYCRLERRRKCQDSGSTSPRCRSGQIRSSPEAAPRF